MKYDYCCAYICWLNRPCRWLSNDTKHKTFRSVSVKLQAICYVDEVWKADLLANTCFAQFAGSHHWVSKFSQAWYHQTQRHLGILLTPVWHLLVFLLDRVVISGFYQNGRHFAHFCFLSVRMRYDYCCAVDTLYPHVCSICVCGGWVDVPACVWVWVWVCACS